MVTGLFLSCRMRIIQALCREALGGRIFKFKCSFCLFNASAASNFVCFHYTWSIFASSIHCTALIAIAGGRARLVQVMMERPGGLLEWEGVGYGNAPRATYKSSAGTEWRACTSLDKCHTASSDQLVCVVGHC